MIPYFGSKSIIIDLYPPPRYGKVIEPFCGSARYALKHFDNEVLLVDKYPEIITCWLYLQLCSEKDILGLPAIEKGMDLRTMNLSDGERIFLGFMCGTSSISPRNKPSPFAIEKNGRRNQYKRIADQLYKIRHWKIKLGSYEDIPNQEATWFIDAPYQKAGRSYKENKIDFNKLGPWSKERSGQVIVCENMGADWMPFKPLIAMRGSNGKKAIEAIWSNQKTPYDMQQTHLF